MRIIYNKIDKKIISELPRELFEGRVFVIQTEREAEKAIDYLMSFPLLGIDTETRPSFRKGHTNKVALLQVSTEDTCFLFRLNRIGITPAILRLLQDRQVCKVGLSLKDDFLSLHEREDFTPGGFVDLQNWVKCFGIEDMSLQKLYANLFGRKISKGQRLTNWEADVLTEGQQRYAATDAWACVQLYKALKEMEETGDYIVKKIEPEVIKATGTETGE